MKVFFIIFQKVIHNSQCKKKCEEQSETCFHSTLIAVGSTLMYPAQWLACWPMSLCLSFIYLIFPWLNGILHVLFYTLFPSIVSFGHNILIQISFIYMQCAIFYYRDLPSFTWVMYSIYKLFPSYSIISITMRKILDFFTFWHLCDYLQGFISRSGNSLSLSYELLEFGKTDRFFWWQLGISGCSVVLTEALP